MIQNKKATNAEQKAYNPIKYEYFKTQVVVVLGTYQVLVLGMALL